MLGQLKKKYPPQISLSIGNTEGDLQGGRRGEGGGEGRGVERGGGWRGGGGVHYGQWKHFIKIIHGIFRNNRTINLLIRRG